MPPAALTLPKPTCEGQSSFLSHAAQASQECRNLPLGRAQRHAGSNGRANGKSNHTWKTSTCSKRHSLLRSALPAMSTTASVSVRRLRRKNACGKEAVHRVRIVLLVLGRLAVMAGFVVKSHSLEIAADLPCSPGVTRAHLPRAPTRLLGRPRATKNGRRQVAVPGFVRVVSLLCGASRQRRRRTVAPDQAARCSNYSGRNVVSPDRRSGPRVEGDERVSRAALPARRRTLEMLPLLSGLLVSEEEASPCFRL